MSNSAEAEQFRAALTPKVADALWNELDRQRNSDSIDAPYVDREMGIIDGEINMTAVADAAIDAVLAAMNPPF